MSSADRQERPAAAEPAPETSTEAPETSRERPGSAGAEPAETPAEKAARLQDLAARCERSVGDASARLGDTRAGLGLPAGESDPPAIALDKAALARYQGQAAEAKPEAREAARAERVAELRRHLAAYLELKSDADAESLRFETAGGLTGDYAEQFKFMNDPRLAETMIAVVPDRLWVKGSQPSESSAERDLILVREGYLKDPAKEHQDEVAWMTHELGHIQRGKDAGERYAAESEEKAFDDIETGTYPNNKVEEHAFGRQFAYLRSKGVPRERVAELLKDEYGPEDFRFLDKLLDRTYGQ